MARHAEGAGWDLSALVGIVALVEKWRPKGVYAVERLHEGEKTEHQLPSGLGL